MDLGEKDKFGFERRSEDQLNYQMGSSSSPCPSVSMVDSFSPGLWNLPTNSQGMVMPSRPDMGGVFLPPGPGALPPSLSHFPTDSAFIERAARFSCFNGGAGNPFGASESLSPYSSSSKVSPRAQKNEMSRTDAPSDASMSLNRNNNSGEPEFSGIGQEGTSNLGNAAGDSSPRGLGANKRKRIGQDMELEQEGTHQLATDTTEKNVAGKQRVEQNSSTMATVKSSGKQATDSPEGSKDDIIHVRARRGQATNSHSLAERVRREKISERMKFLQDLVPGCSKVTGKAVMLDEIINYVQSLQKQVEFLSMKLATVNPRLDFNIEGLLSKDFLQPRGGPSSSMGFSHDMMHPQLHLPQQGLIPAGMADMAHPSDALRRALNAQLIMANGYKDTSPQMPNAWDDVLHNVIQMNFGATNPPLNNQDLSSKPRDGFSI